jgi:hypothetical protein
VPFNERKPPLREYRATEKSLNTAESLPNHSYPLWWIVCGTIEISPAEDLVMATQERHDGNRRHGFPKMGDKPDSFLPRSSVSDHDNSHSTIREIEVSRGPRTQDRNDRMPKTLKNIFTDRQETRTIFDLHNGCHAFVRYLAFFTFRQQAPKVESGDLNKPLVGGNYREQSFSVEGPWLTDEHGS